MCVCLFYRKSGLIAVGPDYLEVNTFRLEVMSITKEASLKGHVNPVKVKPVQRLRVQLSAKYSCGVLKSPISTAHQTLSHVLA